jgi:hypothetical protein
MSLNLVAHVRLAHNCTVQAIRFATSALRIIQKLRPQIGLPPNPIKPLLYQDAIDSLTEALFGIRALPLDIQYPTDPIYLRDPVVPQDNRLIIRLSDNRATLALNNINDAITFIEQARSQTDDDGLGGQLFSIQLDLEATRDALVAGLDESPFAEDEDAKDEDA